MPALMPTNLIGTITWLGVVRQRAQTLVSSPVEELSADFGGVEGEEHAGLTRSSCSRVIDQYPRGTEIRNARQFSVLSDEELKEIAALMGLDAISPALVGASMVIRGIPDFTHLPPSSRLQSESGATLVVDMENRPCQLPAKPVEARHPGFGSRFRDAAKGRRGVVAWVERPGLFRLGDRIRLHIPDQRPWAPLDPARAVPPAG